MDWPIFRLTMRPLACLSLVALCCAAATPQAAPTNLALFEPGGIPSARDAAPDLTYGAQKAADGSTDTGWVSGEGGYPTWLRIEWRFAVQVDELVLRQWPACPVAGVGPIGAYTMEALVDGQWRPVASGDASGLPREAEVRSKPTTPLVTTAIRLTVSSSPARRVAVSELQVLGPHPVLPLNWAPAWQGRLIWTQPSLGMAQRQPVRRYLRRSFTLERAGEVTAAYLAACAFDRLTTLWLNNVPLLADISYNGGLCRQAKTRRVATDTLREGENVLAASVDDIYECGSHGLLAELVLVRADGTRAVIATDTNWKGQEDQGLVPAWRKPGFRDTGWVPCSVVAGPNGRWHWLWNVPHPELAPRDTLTVVGLEVSPPQVRAGTDATCRLTFECTRRPGADYAVAVRLGQPSLMADHDFELWGAAMPPREAATSAWEAGRHTVVIKLHVPPEAPRDTPATLLVSLPDAGCGLATSLPGCQVDAYGLHFTIPVLRETAGAPAATAAPPAGFTPSEVRTVGGTPTLHLAGRPVAPILWSSSYGNYRRYSAYAASGVKLFRPLIAGSPICAPHEADDYYPWWLARVDEMLSAAVSVDPDIKLLPAVAMDPSPQVLFDEPSEQMVSGRGHLVIDNSLFYPDLGQVRPTFMSQAWRRLGAEGLTRLVQHMAAQPYARSVVGLCFFAGRAGENYYGGNELNLFINEQGAYDARPQAQWDVGDFSAAARQTLRRFLVDKYGTDEALRTAWRRADLRFDDIPDPARFRREEVCDTLVGLGRGPSAGSLRDARAPGVGSLPMDYYQCFAEAMIDTFAAWGHAVKQASAGRLLTGCYYGYAAGQLLTCLPGFAGHTALARACDTPDLDFLCSPIDYSACRRAGSPVWAYNIPDSLRLHNKLWIYEFDSRTHLAAIGPKTYSSAETVAVMQRDAALALTHGAGWWWYEFSEGQRGAQSREWFLDPEFLASAGQLKRVYDHSLALPDRGPSAQIAVFYHGETLTAQDIFPPTLALNISLSRLTLFDSMPRIGAPYDLYNLADIVALAESGRLSQYRMCLFLNPFYLTAADRQALERCKSEGRTLVWLWGPGLGQVGESLSVERVAAVTGIPAIRLLPERAVPTCRMGAEASPLLQGLAAGYELAPRVFSPGDQWERFGNEIGPLLYVDPQATGPDTRILGHWVLGGKLRPDMGAFCLREMRRDGVRQWASVYSAVPYLSPELLRNIAREAGVHIYRETNGVLFADRHFVAIHTGAQPATDLLRLPLSTTIHDVLNHRTVGRDTASLQLNVPAYSTALYYLGEGPPE